MSLSIYVVFFRWEMEALMGGVVYDRYNDGFHFAKIFDTLEPNAINARLYAAISQEVEGLTALEIEGNVTAADDGLYAIKVKYALNGVPQPTLNLTLNI